MHTAQDVAATIATWTDVSPPRRANLASSVAIAARICEPEAITLECRYLNGHLFAHPPRALGFSDGRFSAVVSDVRHVLRRLGRHAPDRRGLEALTPQWRALHDLLPDKRQLGIRGFMTYCSDTGQLPETVTFEAVAAFETWCMDHTLCRNLSSRTRRITAVWNWACKHQQGWLGAPVVRPAKRARFVSPLMAYPQAFQEDVERFFQQLSHGTTNSLDDVFDDTAGPSLQRKPSKPRTIVKRRYMLLQAAAALTSTGHDPASLTSLRDLVHPTERAVTIMRVFRDRSGKNQSATLGHLAETVRMIARDHCRLPQDEVDKFTRLVKRVKPKRQLRMTEKNRQRLRALVQPGPRAMLLHMPQELMRRAKHPKTTPMDGARWALLAVALEILLICPLRRGNLTGLQLDRHLQRPDPRKRRVGHLSLLPGEVKNDEAIDWPIPAESAALIETYERRFRPLLAAPGNRFLFPGTGDRPRSDQGLATALAQLVEREIGVQFNCHIARHFAGWTYLQRHPGEYEVLRRVLGHKDIATTIAYYTGLETDAAAQRFDAVVLRDRQATRAMAAHAFRKGRGGLAKVRKR